MFFLTLLYKKALKFLPSSLFPLSQPHVLLLNNELKRNAKDWYQTVVKSRAYECNHSAQKCFLLTGDLINFSFNTSKYLNQDQLAKARLWDVLEKFN